MAVTKHIQRKVIEFTYDAEVVKGNFAAIEARKPGEAEYVEKKDVDNTGKSTLTFPQDFVGDSEVLVRGSASGEDSGTITVE